MRIIGYGRTKLSYGVTFNSVTPCSMVPPRLTPTHGSSASIHLLTVTVVGLSQLSEKIKMLTWQLVLVPQGDGSHWPWVLDTASSDNRKILVSRGHHIPSLIQRPPLTGVFEYFERPKVGGSLWS